MKTTKTTKRRVRRRRSIGEMALRLIVAIFLIPFIFVFELLKEGIKYPKRFLTICFIGSMLITFGVHTFNVYFPGYSVDEKDDQVEVISETIFYNNKVNLAPASTAEPAKTIIVESAEELSNVIVEETDEALEEVKKQKAIEEKLLKEKEEKERKEREKKEKEERKLAKAAEKKNKIMTAQNVSDSLGFPRDYDAVLMMSGMCYLVDEKGFTPEGAAGLMGNAYCESRFFVGADNGSHFGIFQWDYYDRWPRISNYMEKIGISKFSRYDNYSSLNESQKIEIFLGQLRASLESSDAQYYSNTIEGCKKATSASYSAEIWRKYYEVCGELVYERQNNAEQILKLYKNIF